jgi:hypothetical protein
MLVFGKYGLPSDIRHILKISILSIFGVFVRFVGLRLGFVDRSHLLFLSLDLAVVVGFVTILLAIAFAAAMYVAGISLNVSE